MKKITIVSLCISLLCTGMLLHLLMGLVIPIAWGERWEGYVATGIVPLLVIAIMAYTYELEPMAIFFVVFLCFMLFTLANVYYFRPDTPSGVKGLFVYNFCSRVEAVECTPSE